MAQVRQLIQNLETKHEAKDELISLGKRAVDDLLEALLNSTTKQRWIIISILGKIGDPRAIPDISDSLKFQNRAIQIAAAQCLGDIGDDLAIPALLEALSSADPTLQIWIVQALGKLAAKQAVTALIQLVHETPSPTVRYNAIEALGRIGNDQVIGDLKLHANDENHHVRDRVQTAITQLRDTVSVVP